MKTCRDCGESVSPSAKTCPKCGCRNPGVGKGGYAVAVISAGIIGAVVFYVVWSTMMGAVNAVAN